jgi:hypothetical protein
LLLECNKELSVLGQVRDIDEDAHEVIAKGLTLVSPPPMNDLRLAGDGTELLL